jgi:hypothetical protein
VSIPGILTLTFSGVTFVVLLLIMREQHLRRRAVRDLNELKGRRP